MTWWYFMQSTRSSNASVVLQSFTSTQPLNPTNGERICDPKEACVSTALLVLAYSLTRMKPVIQEAPVKEPLSRPISSSHAALGIEGNLRNWWQYLIIRLRWLKHALTYSAPLTACCKSKSQVAGLSREWFRLCRHTLAHFQIILPLYFETALIKRKGTVRGNLIRNRIDGNSLKTFSY